MTPIKLLNNNLEAVKNLNSDLTDYLDTYTIERQHRYAEDEPLYIEIDPSRNNTYIFELKDLFEQYKLIELYKIVYQIAHIEVHSAIKRWDYKYEEFNYIVIKLRHASKEVDKLIDEYNSLMTAYGTVDKKYNKLYDIR